MAGRARVVWFVHGPDEGCLRWSVWQAIQAFPIGTTFHVFADRKAGLSVEAVRGLDVAGVEYQETHWDRGGNLNGLEAVDGILGAMGGVAKCESDVIWKCDADTLVGDAGVLLDWFRDPNVIGAGLRCPFAEGWWGISYALRAQVIGALAGSIRGAGQAGLAQIGLSQGHEDLVISRWLALHERPARLRTWMTKRTGGAFCAHNYQGGSDPRQALRKWGIVTFGNRWQIEGAEALRRQMVAKSMRLAAGGWRLDEARAWRSGAAQGLWAVGSLLRFGKSVEKGALKCPKVA